MNLHILGALCFLAPPFRNNLILNDIDFRFTFVFYHYPAFFSITFPDRCFVVLYQDAEKHATEVMPHRAVAAVSDRRTVGARHGVPLLMSLGIGHNPRRRRRGAATGSKAVVSSRCTPHQAHFPRVVGEQFRNHPLPRQRRITRRAKKNCKASISVPRRGTGAPPVSRHLFSLFGALILIPAPRCRPEDVAQIRPPTRAEGKKALGQRLYSGYIICLVISGMTFP